ncbi:hypothetical protein G9A89_019510 [Geosiphon pyriformis]|nr:hypothetical protein G9A89_019510 [Geosiphon pyriformis]
MMLSVFENWTNQIETELSFPLVAFILVLSASFKIKLAHVKAVFQSVHGFLDVKSVFKNNVKLFCMEFVSQSSLDAAFLVELTSSVYLATLKIAKSLVVSKSDFCSAAIVLHNVPLNVSAANIKTALGVFGSITHIVLKPTGIWQYVVVYFEKLGSAVSVLNHWSILVNKNSVRILFLVNQNKTILFYDRFKAKLVNFLSGCTFGHYFQFALVIFSSLVDLDIAVLKTGSNYLALNCKMSLSLSLKALKIFTSHGIGDKSYVKATASVLFLVSSIVNSLASSTKITSNNSVVSSWLTFLEFDLTKLITLVNFIVKPIGSLVEVFKQFINRDLASSSNIGLEFKEVLVHISNFSKAIDKLEQDIVALKNKCNFINISMSGPYVNLSDFDDNMFFNLILLWKHELANVKLNVFRTAKWLIVHKMSSLDKFFSSVSNII